MSLEALRRGDLAGARALKLDCGLTELPQEIFGLADTLESLDLSGNHLTALPDQMGRLRRLRVLFCSGNRFTRLPPVLGDCASLSQIGFRSSFLRELPAESLPPMLRWLTLTDNRLEAVPAALGERPGLQKLMLAGNRLQDLPNSLAQSGNLELLRLSANRFERLPPWLASLPRLAWLAWAGNPLDRYCAPPRALEVHWSELSLGRRLGEGASGLVHQAEWRDAGGLACGRPVALKLFKAAMTSDGDPESEMTACLAAGEHANLTGGLGRLIGHPTRQAGLLMTLLPSGWRALAGPPSLESCSRDIYDPQWNLDRAVLLRIVRDVAKGAAHLHARGLTHGDLYAHNTLWDGDAGCARLSDFGAASFLPADPAAARLPRLDVLAWAILLGELLDRCTSAPADLASLRALHESCARPEPSLRPSFADILDQLARLHI